MYEQVTDEPNPEPLVLDTSNPVGAVTVMLPLAGVKFEPLTVYVNSLEVVLTVTSPNARKVCEIFITGPAAAIPAPLTATFLVDALPPALVILPPYVCTAVGIK